MCCFYKFSFGYMHCIRFINFGYMYCFSSLNFGYELIRQATFLAPCEFWALNKCCIALRIRYGSEHAHGAKYYVLVATAFTINFLAQNKTVDSVIMDCKNYVPLSFYHFYRSPAQAEIHKSLLF